MQAAENKTRVRLRIEGRVQGVFFRASAVEQGKRLGVTGWTRNLSDGSVEVVAEGEKQALDALIAWCRQGPPRARVERVQVEREEFKNEFRSFHVR